jgi:hypothetical protein
MEFQELLVDELARLQKEINRQKHELIQAALITNDIELDLDSIDPHARFKPLLIVEDRSKGSQIVYYNDGTPEGKKLITFQDVLIDNVGAFGLIPKQDNEMFNVSLRYEIHND